MNQVLPRIHGDHARVIPFHARKCEVAARVAVFHARVQPFGARRANKTGNQAMFQPRKKGYIKHIPFLNKTELNERSIKTVSCRYFTELGTSFIYKQI